MHHVVFHIVCARLIATSDGPCFQPVQQVYIDVESHELKDRDNQESNYSLKRGISDAGDSASEMKGDQYEVKVKTEQISVAR